MEMDPAPGWAMDYYSGGQEQERLATPPGRLELERTQELLLRHLPVTPSRVADIGAGPGVYSLWLARAGHEVVARDLVPLHIEQLRRDAAQQGLDIDAAVADARDLDLPDASCDAALLLGPLYHLTDRVGRLACLREAARIVRPGGVVAATVISRWALLMDAVLLHRIGEGDHTFPAVLDAAMNTGVMAPLSPGGFSGFCHRPEELRAEAGEAGLREVSLVPVEGPGAYLADLGERWESPAAREAVLDVARRLEDVPEMLGIGGHLLLVAAKE